ncbi:MAG: protoporphyrinogen oxidase [Gammaproteobacteria bacterium]|nr:protoporphyrinogen oxidase [Gammaproteobacteria bacterium]
MNDVDLLVIGGGISGLTTAWWAVRAGMSVEVWEASERAGGKIRSERQDGYLTEQSASLLLNFRPEVSELVRRLDLEKEKSYRSAESEAHRYLLNNGQLTPMPMKLGSMISSPLWSLKGKLRLLAEPFMPASKHEDETVSQFITRRLGLEMLEKAMEPFIAGTLAADAQYASAAATLPRLTGLEQRYGSITAGVLINKLLRRRTACTTETFSFNGGMETLVQTLAATPGINLRTGYRMVELIPNGKSGWSIIANTALGTETRRARQVVLSTPAPVAANAVAPLNNELAELLEGINYAPLAVLHMGFDRSQIGHALDATGFLVPKTERLPFNGNLWMSALFPNRAPVGKALLTTYLGGARQPEAFEWSKQQMTEQVIKALRPLLNLQGEPEMVSVHRHQQALPLYHGAYQARLSAIEKQLKKLPGLHLEANYRGGVSIRDRIARGEQLVKKMVELREQKKTRHNSTPHGQRQRVTANNIQKALNP